MEELRLSAVATRVVAWHNRHPLARRITAAQVHAIGYVALPFAGPVGTGGGQAGDAAEETAAAEAPQPGGTLRERAQARARQQPAAGAPDGVPTVTQLAVDPTQLAADFSENFIDPLTPRQVEAFARRHGQALVRAPADGPLRRVRADGRQPDGGGLTLYLLTAVIETGTRKSRVLLGGGNTPAVMGRRVLARGRVMAGFVPLLALGVGAYLSLRPLSHGPVLAAAPAASAASSVSPASAPAPNAMAVAASAPASAPIVAVAAHPAASVASAPAHEPAASAPLDVEPRLGRIDMPSIKPHLDPRSQAAARTAEAASAAARQATAHAAPAATPPTAAAPAAPVKVAAPPPAVGAFALSTRLLRTRAEADQVRVAMRSLLKAIDAAEVRVDVMPEGEDWRVVGLPFTSRSEADKARALLVSRGMRVEVVPF